VRRAKTASSDLQARRVQQDFPERKGRKEFRATPDLRDHKARRGRKETPVPQVHPDLSCRALRLIPRSAINARPSLAVADRAVDQPAGLAAFRARSHRDLAINMRSTHFTRALKGVGSVASL
jgi:hypothetical protein